MHQHVEWDEPGSASVAEYFKNDPDHQAPDPGDIISARYPVSYTHLTLPTIYSV